MWAKDWMGQCSQCVTLNLCVPAHALHGSRWRILSIVCYHNSEVFLPYSTPTFDWLVVRFSSRFLLKFNVSKSNNLHFYFQITHIYCQVSLWCLDMKVFDTFSYFHWNLNTSECKDMFWKTFVWSWLFEDVLSIKKKKTSGCKSHWEAFVLEKFLADSNVIEHVPSDRTHQSKWKLVLCRKPEALAVQSA